MSQTPASKTPMTVNTSTPFSGQDETLKCKDCKEEFVFTVGEQDFYAEKGFTNKPTRCKPCRETHKANKNQPHTHR